MLACLRLTLPVPVSLKRFAAPRCVLSFGTVSLSGSAARGRGTLPQGLAARRGRTLCGRGPDALSFPIMHEHGSAGGTGCPRRRCRPYSSSPSSDSLPLASLTA